jgi:hypothetical protein
MVGDKPKVYQLGVFVGPSPLVLIAWIAVRVSHVTSQGERRVEGSPAHLAGTVSAGCGRFTGRAAWIHGPGGETSVLGGGLGQVPPAEAEWRARQIWARSAVRRQEHEAAECERAFMTAGSQFLEWLAACSGATAGCGEGVGSVALELLRGKPGKRTKYVSAVQGQGER